MSRLIAGLVVFAAACPLFAEEAFVSPTQSAAESAARRQNAEDSFEGIIAPQNIAFDNALKNKQALPAADAAVPDMFQNNRLAPPPAPSFAPPITETAAPRTVTMSLESYEALQEALRAARDRDVLKEGPAVILGASEYSGKVVSGVLALRLRLTVILGAGDTWKTVPLVGEDVVLEGAEVDDAPIATTRQNGYLVWQTRRTGEIRIDIDLLVPSRGPKGSIEYDFFAPKTPVTRISCFFPAAGLEPKIADARQSKATPEGQGTRFEAVLKPTSRIHIVGYKDIAADEEAKAGLFTESMNLVSIDEGGLDVFSVFRYTILYAAAKAFHINIPKGMTVVSAEGDGAFTYVLEETEGGTVLRGETAFPVRNSFEISLRLKRREILPGTPFEIPLPRAANAEREHGFIAIETPGKLKVQEISVNAAVTVDVRQLPEEMVRSAVSPIIKAYRFHSPETTIALTAEKLPEKELKSAAIDRIRAFSVISTDGKMLTDMRIRMRNRLLPSLTVAIPRQWKLLSAHLDGEAIRPNLEGDTAVILPLKRSVGNDASAAFTLQVVLEGGIRAFGPAGRAAIRLPATQLPASSAAWTVYLPANNTYTALEAETDRQRFAGEAVWHTSPYSNAPVRPLAEQTAAEIADADLSSDGAGLVAVRIELPKSGKRLDYTGYWIEANKPVTLGFYYLQSRLLLPFGVVMALLVALGAVLLFAGAGVGTFSRILGAGLIAVSGVPLYLVSGAEGIVGTMLLCLLVVGYRHRVLSRSLAWYREAIATFSARYRARDVEATKLRVGRVLAALCMGGVGLLLLGVLAGLLRLLLARL